MADYSDLGFEPAGNSHADLGFVPTPARIPGVTQQVFTSLQNQAKGMFEMLHGLVDPEVAMKIGGNELDAQAHEWQRAKDNYAKGDYVGAMTGALGAAVPILGPFINQTAEKLATEGKRAEGATDILAPLVAGKVISNIPDVAEGIGTAKAVLSDPAVIRAGVKVLPKGPAMVSAYDTIKGAIDRAHGVESPASPPVEAAPAASTIPPGVPPEVWQKLTPEFQDRLRQKIAGVAPQAAAKGVPIATAPVEWRTPEEIAKANAPALQASPAVPTTSTEVGGGGPLRPPLAETPPGQQTHFPEDTALTEKLRQLNRDLAIKAGLDPDQHLGMLKGGQYTARFDSGDPNSPIIDSTLRKPYSTADVANPQLITKAAADKVGSKLAGVVSPEQFDKMVKNPQVKEIIGKLAGQEPDAKLLSAIRRRIANNPGQAPTGYTIADLMKDIK